MPSFEELRDIMKLQFSFKTKLRVVKQANTKEKKYAKHEVDNLIYLREPTTDAPQQRRPSLSDANLGHSNEDQKNFESKADDNKH